MKIEKLKKIAVLAIESPNENERTAAIKILKKNGINDPCDIMDIPRKRKCEKRQNSTSDYNDLTLEYIDDFINQINSIGVKIEDKFEATFGDIGEYIKNLFRG